MEYKKEKTNKQQNSKTANPLPTAPLVSESQTLLLPLFALLFVLPLLISTELLRISYSFDPSLGPSTLSPLLNSFLGYGHLCHVFCCTELLLKEIEYLLAV